jgi:hypothetical protein
MESEEQIYVPCFQDGPLRQGEIVTGLIQARLNIDSINLPEPIVDYIIHPYAIARDEDVMGEGLPELGIDFKRYFTISAAEVYIRLDSNEIQRRCRLVSPYLEHFSTRFAYYQFRVALPADHYSEPTQN